MADVDINASMSTAMDVFLIGGRSKWILVYTCEYKMTLHLKENQQSKIVKIYNIYTNT